MNPPCLCGCAFDQHYYNKNTGLRTFCWNDARVAGDCKCGQYHANHRWAGIMPVPSLRALPEPKKHPFSKQVEPISGWKRFWRWL